MVFFDFGVVLQEPIPVLHLCSKVKVIVKIVDVVSSFAFGRKDSGEREETLRRCYYYYYYY